VVTNFFLRSRAFDPSITEIMDRPQPVSAHLTVDLANLRRINRYFGSYALIRHFLALASARRYCLDPRLVHGVC